MKTAIFALLVLVAVSQQGEALTCNCAQQYCSGTQYCMTSEDLKPFGQWGFGPNPVCGSTVYYTGDLPSFKGCHEPSECGWSFHPYRSYTTCCSTDLCN